MPWLVSVVRKYSEEDPERYMQPLTSYFLIDQDVPGWAAFLQEAKSFLWCHQLVGTSNLHAGQTVRAALSNLQFKHAIIRERLSRVRMNHDRREEKIA